MGIWMIVYSGSVPLGALWTGRAAVRFGVDVVMAFSAGLCVGVGLLVMASGVLRPRLHGRLAHPMFSSPEPTASMIASSTIPPHGEGWP